MGCFNCQLTPSQHYPNIKIDGQMVKFHRLVWERGNGPIPKGIMVCHSCDNRRCINLQHLFLGDAQANMDDKVSKGRQHFGGPGHRIPLKKYEEIVAKRYRGLSYEEISCDYRVSSRTIRRFLAECPHD